MVKINNTTSIWNYTYSTDDDGLIGCKASTLCYDSLPSGESVSIMVRGCIKGIFKIREFWKRVYLNEDANEVFESYREKGRRKVAMKRMVEWKYINEDSKKYDNGKITNKDIDMVSRYEGVIISKSEDNYSVEEKEILGILLFKIGSYI